MLKAAIIGLGDIAMVHIPLLQNAPYADLTAVCDIDVSRAAKVKDTAFYTNINELLQKEQLDVLHICLPHYLHYSTAKIAAEHGVNVFCEKPVALNEKEAEKFRELANKYSNLKFGLCLQNRYNKTVQRLLEIIKTEQYGKILAIKAIVAWNRPPEYFAAAPWRGKMSEAGGGVMINQSVHTLDLMQLFGGEISSIKGNVSQLLEYGIEVEDTASALFRFKSGATGLFFASIANSKNSSIEMEITLQNAVFSLRDNTLMKINENGSELICKDDLLTGAKFYYGASHAKAFEAFYKSLNESGDDYIPISEGVIGMKIIDAIRKSSEEKKIIKF